MVVMVFLVCGLGSLQAQGIPAMPKWILEYNNAYYLYQAGANEISTDPAAAVQTLQSAQKFDEYAVQNGGSYYAVELSEAINRALVSAQSQARNSKPGNSRSATVHRSLARPTYAAHSQPLRLNIVRN